MATTTITWKNNSTDQSPTGTKIERYEGFPKGHEHATAPVEVANGNTGGLDPTLANGTYDDTTSGGKYYSYNVSTVKGDEVASGVPTASEWVADQDNDLGYVGGVPEIGSTYNCSVAPALHIDLSRAKDYYAPLAEQVATDAVAERVDNGFSGVIRANTEDFTYENVQASSQASFFSDAATDGDGIALVGQAPNQIDKVPFRHPNKIAFKDGVTVFRVVSGQFGVGDYFAGVQSYGPMGDGINYATGKFQSTKFNVMDSGDTSFTLSGGKEIPGMNGNGTRNSSTTTALYVLAMRLNNSLEAFNSGEIRGQVFSAGNLVATTADVSAKSYHNEANNPDATSTSRGLGAWYFPPSTGTTSYRLHLLNNQYKVLLAGETILFGEALSLSDMNQVFGYLCNKHGITQQVISSSDLVN